MPSCSWLLKCRVNISREMKQLRPSKTIKYSTETSPSLRAFTVTRLELFTPESGAEECAMD